MPAKGSKPARMVAFDGDKIGAVAGSLVALVVAGIQIFFREADLMTTVVRSAWVFVGAYTAVFFLVRRTLQISLFEMLADKEARGKASADTRGAGEKQPQWETAAAKP